MKRSPAAAFWLSLIPGAGHVYIGQAGKGLVLILLAASTIQFVERGADGFGILIPFIWIAAMVDAHRGALELNHLLETGQTLPKSMSLAFSRWWGWGLIVVGVLFALENFGLFDIDWIWDLWPLALIGLGVYILRKPTPIEVANEPALPPAPSESKVDEVTIREDDAEHE